jgi:hypothetical protein
MLLLAHPESERKTNKDEETKDFKVIVVPLQKRVERVLIGSVDIGLGKDRPLDVLAVCERLDIFRCAWLLRTKLIAGNADDLQSLFGVLTMRQIESVVPTARKA